jgi:hypothetical protein
MVRAPDAPERYCGGDGQRRDHDDFTITGDRSGRSGRFSHRNTERSGCPDRKISVSQALDRSCECVRDNSVVADARRQRRAGASRIVWRYAPNWFCSTLLTNSPPSVNV